MSRPRISKFISFLSSTLCAKIGLVALSVRLSVPGRMSASTRVSACGVPGDRQDEDCCKSLPSGFLNRPKEAPSDREQSGLDPAKSAFRSYRLGLEGEPRTL